MPILYRTPLLLRWCPLVLLVASTGCVTRPLVDSRAQDPAALAASLPAPMMSREQWAETLKTIRAWDPHASLRKSPDVPGVKEYTIDVSTSSSAVYGWKIIFNAAGSQLCAMSHAEPSLRLWFKTYAPGAPGLDVLLYKVLLHPTRLRIVTSPLGPSMSLDYRRDQQWLYLESSSETFLNMKKAPALFQKDVTLEIPAPLKLKTEKKARS